MGTIGLGAEAKWNTCEDIEKNSVDSIAAWAIRDGKSAGFVTTTSVTHASIAGTYAHTPHRNWENNAKVGKDYPKCKDIAYQMVKEFPGKDFKVN